MSFWHWTQFHLFLLFKYLWNLINKGNTVIFNRTKFLYFNPVFGYLKIILIFWGTKKALFYKAFTIFHSNFYTSSRIHMNFVLPYYLIICIYNITCISGFSRLGNIYIICIIRTIYIINISLLWTNCGHRPHPFTANIIPYFKVQ